MINLSCPHCSPVDHFELARAEPEGRTFSNSIEVYGKVWRWPRRIKPKQTDPSGEHRRDPDAQKPVTVTERGKYRIITLDEKDLRPSWRGFRVEILGMDYGLALPLPPGPLFHAVTTSVWSLQGEGGPTERQIFNACRITKGKSKVDVRVHWWPDHRDVVAALGGPGRKETVQWWPDHGRIVTVRGLTLGRKNTAEIEQLNQALTLFSFFETRGRRTVITEEALSAAFGKLGRQATQTDVANELNVSDRALRKYQQRMEKSDMTWPEFWSLYGDRN